MADGTLISSAQYPARVGYKETWVTNGKDWSGTEAFLRREELPNEVAVALTAVRTQPKVNKPFYAVGGRRLDQEFSGFAGGARGNADAAVLESGSSVPSRLTSLARPATVEQPERFAPMIAQLQKQPTPLVQTIQWNADAESAEVFHVLPLTGRNGELLGRCWWEVRAATGVADAPHHEDFRGGGGRSDFGWAVADLVGVGAHHAADRRTGRRCARSGRRALGHANQFDAGGTRPGNWPTAFNHMTQTLASQRERLVQTERVAAWRELARRLAHELRNPLFPLQITVENMQRARQLSHDQFLEVFNESTATLKAELANLNSIVNRFSDFSKMPPPEFSRVDINEVIRSAVRLFEPQFHEVGKPTIATEYFLKEGLPEIDGDPELLHKAFQNLVLNALDAMPAGGTLTFRTAETQPGIRIEVSDTGKGLTPEECSRLFTPYYTTKQQGTGLGLAIVQSVVSDHRGTISVASEEGHGTTFRIELPRRQPGVTAKKLQPATTADQVRAGYAGNRGGERLSAQMRNYLVTRKAHLLLVDDDANTLASLSRAFRLAGHEATVCDNADRAVESAAHGKIRPDFFRCGDARKERTGISGGDQERGSEGPSHSDFRAGKYRNGGARDKVGRAGFSGKAAFNRQTAGDC